ncbi:asparagine synthase (glutamine-hydrolyzing) [Sphingomonas sp.]|uniref:asparagine synthase (glutamine-hydrolyzing) n=1 Tax=Sphingomonas sp. TaxID=28214 RepID=UPI002DD6A118|nr:asparagine synthase (glutamine-hydrolyzing) [Sphingomonas sp.]
MCGITGYWSRKTPATKPLVEAMAAIIAHRGPDGGGSWIDDRRDVALAHRRLAIIDLSEAGHQPMISPCDRYVLTYNGEIYNHLELRRELDAAGAAFAWKGHSDTETLLAAIRHWGVRGALERLNGMFAFALWDNKTRELTLARDRMGEKPLYYGTSGGTFFFTSELKALDAHPDWSAEIDRDSVSSFLRFAYVPGPRSIYRGIAKLPPAHFVVVADDGRAVGEPEAYWDLDAVARDGVARRGGSDTEMIEQLDALLRDAVKLRMAADVPLGAFLSGGFDSSIVVALMQAQSSRPVKTFTIGFHEEAYNEATHARAVAEHLGTEHTELYVSPRDALDVIPRLPAIWDEPFADSSQIPTLLLSELTRKHVTVSLSGDGGDELFCGYNRYAMGYAMWSKLRLLPYPARRMLAGMMKRFPSGMATAIGDALPGGLRQQNLGDRLPKMGDVIATREGRDYYRRLVSHWKTPDEIVIGGSEPHLDAWDAGWSTLDDVRDQMMLVDSKTYLPDDILVKVDRASMDVSLESRVPLLDHRVVEFAWRTPLAMKQRGAEGKWLLRQVLYKYVPQKLMDRPKMGFGVPIDSWLAGPLRDWAEALLDERRLREQGILDPQAIRAMWAEHLSGGRRWHYLLWDVLMFQAWLENRGSAAAEARLTAKG